MPIISVRIPQLGEGLQEALLVEFLKKPGDQIKRDEPIYVMETDKATTDVESPYSGTLVEWTAQPGAVLEIGTEVARMEVAEGTREMAAGHGPDHSAAPSSSNQPKPPAEGSTASNKPLKRPEVVIPPKTRKYLKELNLLDEADQIPCAGSKLMPEDVDAYLSTRQTAAQVDSSLYNLVPLPKSQIVLNYRLGRATKVTVPVTVMTDINWSAVQHAREEAKKSGGPTGFAMACWAVVQAMNEHDKFRSSLTADGNQLKVFHNVNLGVAVALPGDEMVTAVIKDANLMTANEFFQSFEAQVLKARDGKDQADESTTVTVSNIGKAGMRMGIPAIVAPAVGTLAIGEVFQHPVPHGDSFKFQPTVTATLSFDHRIANGVGAANFLNSVKSRIESILLQ